MLQIKQLGSVDSNRDYLGTPYVPVYVTLPVSETHHFYLIISGSYINP